MMAWVTGFCHDIQQGSAFLGFGSCSAKLSHILEKL